MERVSMMQGLAVLALRRRYPGATVSLIEGGIITEIDGETKTTFGYRVEQGGRWVAYADLGDRLQKLDAPPVLA